MAAQPDSGATVDKHRRATDSGATVDKHGRANDSGATVDKHGRATDSGEPPWTSMAAQWPSMPNPFPDP
jgi:hypothetical protein